jgi:hypothetical protein
MVPVPPAATVKAVVQAREAAVKPAGVKSAAVEPAAVEPTKSATVEAAAVEVAAMESAAATVRCVGEIRLAENGRAQQRSCNADHTPPVSGPGSAIA